MSFSFTAVAGMTPAFVLAWVMPVLSTLAAPELPAGAEAAARAALAQFRPSVEASRKQFGFQAEEDLQALKLESPIAVTTFNVKKLESSGNSLDHVAAYLEADSGDWFPVSLNGRFRGIVSVVLAKNRDRWLPEGFGKTRLASVLEIFRHKYPEPKYQLRIVYAPASPDVYLAIDGLPYDNLSALPVDEDSARRLVDKPALASDVLTNIKVMLSTGGNLQLLQDTQPK